MTQEEFSKLKPGDIIYQHFGYGLAHDSKSLTEIRTIKIINEEWSELQDGRLMFRGYKCNIASAFTGYIIIHDSHLFFKSYDDAFNSMISYCKGMIQSHIFKANYIQERLNGVLNENNL